MPNIYLRLPVSRCQYFRYRDSAHVLAKDEPLKFNAYMPEYAVMRSGLSNAGAVMQQLDQRCFSDQQWRNMLCGCPPLGGKPIVKRDFREYLTFAEVQMLCGNVDYDKSANEDYLCIRLPREVMVVNTIRPITPSWNLSRESVRQLLVMLNNDFKRSVVEWALSTFDFCTSHGRIICRSQAAMLERYLMRYGIEPTRAEKDNLRRIIERWFNQEHCNFRAYSVMDMQYIDPNEKHIHTDEITWA